MNMPIYNHSYDDDAPVLQEIEYFSACYSLIQDTQYNLQLLNTSKEQAFINWLNTFSSEPFKNISISPKKRYTITCKEYQPGKYFMKFARATKKTVNQKVKDDFVPAKVPDYPNCKIFIDTANNIILIEKNLNVAHTIPDIRDLIAKVISKDISSFGYSIRIELVTKVADFWSYVNENITNLQSIEFTLVYPNFLDGFDDVKQFVRGFESYNPEVITTKIENKEGRLTLPNNKNFLKDALAYAASGAGSWKATAKGTHKIKSSESVPNINTLPSDISELRPEQIQHISDIFESIRRISDENRQIGENNEDNN